MLTRDDLIAVLRGTTDVDGWLEPFLADPSSEAILNSLAEIFSRTSVAVDNAANAGMISLAPGGTPASTVITAARAAPGPAGTIPAGFRWVDSRGFTFVSMGDTAVGAGDLSVPIGVRSLYVSELANSEDDLAFEPSAENEPAALALAQSFDTFAATPAAGGASDFLSVHGSERGVQRQNGELSPDYRLRIRNIQDLVSPRAIVEAVHGVTQQHGLPSATVYEAGDYAPDLEVTAAAGTPIVLTLALPAGQPDHGFKTGQTVRVKGVQGNAGANGLWVVTNVAVNQIRLDGSASTGAYAGGGIATLGYDGLDSLEGDDFVEGAFGDFSFLDDSAGFMLSRREAAAYMLIREDAVPRDPDSLRFFYDASFLDDPIFGFPDVAQHPVVTSGLLAIWEEVYRKRAGGVQFDVEVPGYSFRIGQGATALAAQTVVWTLTPPAGKVWLYVDGFFGHTPDPAGASHQVEVRYEDGAVVTTPAFSGPGSQVVTRDDLAALGWPVKRINRVRGVVTSDGVTLVRLVGQFRVLEVTI